MGLFVHWGSCPYKWIIWEPLYGYDPLIDKEIFCIKQIYYVFSQFYTRTPRILDNNDNDVDTILTSRLILLMNKTFIFLFDTPHSDASLLGNWTTDVFGKWKILFFY